MKQRRILPLAISIAGGISQGFLWITPGVCSGASELAGCDAKALVIQAIPLALIFSALVGMVLAARSPRFEKRSLINFLFTAALVRMIGPELSSVDYVYFGVSALGVSTGYALAKIVTLASKLSRPVPGN